MFGDAQDVEILDFSGDERLQSDSGEGFLFLLSVHFPAFLSDLETLSPEIQSKTKTSKKPFSIALCLPLS